MEKLQNKTAIITGGNSGIGFATAKEFIAQGAKVIITGRNQTLLDQAVKDLGNGTKAILCDSAKLSDIQQLAKQVKLLTPHLDIIYLNAGTSEFAPLEHITEEHYDRIFNINVKGLLFTVKELLPLVKENASIIFCSSAAVNKGVPSASVYVASKAALSGFVKSLALELWEKKIRVNAILPGFVDTPLFDKVGLTAEQKEGAIAFYQTKALLNRFALPDEIAKSILFLASDESSYMTGSELLVDGGYTIS